MRVLVTRPTADARRTATELSRRGHRAVLAPVIEIRTCTDDIPNRNYQAVLLTSANAVRALVERRGTARLRDRLLLAVGRASEEAARAAGFFNVVSADGAAEDLLRLARTCLDPAAGPVLFPSGRDVACDLATELGRAGMAVDRVVVYEAAPTQALPKAAVIAIRNGEIDATLSYSPRSARLLAELGRRAGIRDRLARVPWLCLSEAVADAARAGGIHHVLVAARPDEDALLEALDNLAE